MIKQAKTYLIRLEKALFKICNQIKQKDKIDIKKKAQTKLNFCI